MIVKMKAAAVVLYGITALALLLVHEGNGAAAQSGGQAGGPTSKISTSNSTSNSTSSSSTDLSGIIARLFPSSSGSGSNVSALAFINSLNGTVALRGQQQFDRVRNLTEPVNKYYNGVREPLMVVLAKSEGDVQAAVAFARARGLPICVRAGGHDSGGYSLCAGVLIDVSPMNQVGPGT